MLNKDVLEALIAKWLSDSIVPDHCDGPEDAKISNAMKTGIGQGKQAAAQDLKELIRILCY